MEVKKLNSDVISGLACLYTGKNCNFRYFKLGKIRLQRRKGREQTENVIETSKETMVGCFIMIRSLPVSTGVLFMSLFITEKNYPGLMLRTSS